MIFRKTILVAATAILGATAGRAQSFEWELRLDTKFDNHERARLAPVLGIGWETGHGVKHNVLTGGSFTLDFSASPPYSRDIEPLLYYHLTSPRYGLYAGMFERRHLIGIYSRATYSGIAGFYDNIVQGLAMQYHGPGARFEVVLDWDGAQSSTQRESFRVLLAGNWNRTQRQTARWLEAGFSVDWYHLASRAGMLDGVVEHILGEVWIGAGLEKVLPWFERLSLGAGWLHSMDRDRTMTNQGWLSPGGATLDAAVQKWRVGIRNRFYHGVTGPGGGTQMPLWGSVGNRVYKGDPMYASARTYNYTAVYWRPTIGHGVELNLELGLHSDGRRMGFQQVIWVGVTLDNDFFKKK
jgi:hypothetical protein